MTRTRQPPAIEDVLALSPLQQGLYSMAVLTERESGSDPYTIAMAADIVGDLDPQLLRDCAAAMLVRHPNLRAGFLHAALGGNATKTVQVVPTAVELPWRHASADPADVADLENAERDRPFDLTRGPAIRFLLVALPDARWRFVVVAHHIIIDGWSLPLLIGELVALYRAGGDISALPPAPRPYRDYIGWLAGRDQDGSRARWRAHLAELDAPTLLTPALTSAPVLPVQGRARTTEVKLGPEQTRQLLEAARKRGVTLNTVVQLAWAEILSAFTDRADVTFGVTVSGRPAELAGVETMVGLFINTVPLRIRLDPAATVGAQCIALQREAAELRDHSYLGHADLRALGGVGEMFDTLLVYENFPPAGIVGSARFEANGATFIPSAMESLSHFPVTIAAHLADGALTVLVEVLDGALGPVHPAALGERLIGVAGAILSGWDRPLREVSVLLPGEGLAPPPPAEPQPAGVHQVFTETAGRRLGSVALTWDRGQLTYRELDEAADRLAAALTGHGAGTETPVAINLRRGPDYVVAMLGILKAGAVIVPLDPGMPAQRVADIVAQTAAPIVIDAGFLAGIPAEAPTDFRAATVHPDQAAYAVFTSGTTGRPKGVVGTHRALLAYTADHAGRMLRPASARLARPLRVAHAWSFTFDAAWQPLAALLDGHTVHIVGDDVQRDAEALVGTIGRFGLDMIDTTPSMFVQLRNAGLLSTVPLAVLALGGEAVGPAVWQGIREHCAATGMTAYNCYGPTETTVEAVVADIPAYPEPTIGQPTAPTAAYVLDSWLRPVPDGVVGELYLAGAQLTRGYLGRAAETAARFVADPLVAGGRMYRTGDVVRRRAGGGLEFLGRTDDQVKIRGFRVEPGEISAVLQQHPGVRNAHVAVRRTGRGPQLVAYVAVGADRPGRPEAGDLRGALAGRLPRYLVPRHVVVLDELPLTGHGKIDETALAAIEVERQPATAPETPTEKVLAQLLAEVLGSGPGSAGVDVTADFLHLGLDSIAALSLVHAARSRGVAMRARLMLDCNTIRDLAAAVDRGAAATPAALSDDRYGEVGPAPIVSWMYEAGQFRRFTQNVLIALPAGVSAERLEQALQALLDRHDMLRAVLVDDAGGGYRMRTRAPGAVQAREVLRRAHEPVAQGLAAQSREALERIDPTAGSLLQAVWFPQDAVLLMCVHHLATDVVSWYVMVAALAGIYAQIEAGNPPELAVEYTTYRQWTQLLATRAHSEEVVAQHDYWVRQLSAPDPALGARLPDPATDTWSSLRRTDVATDPALTRRLLAGLDAAGIEVRDFLLAALALTITTWRLRRGHCARYGTLIALEGHGREDALLGPAVDTSATVGWFTSVFPVRLGEGQQLGVDAAAGDPAAARTFIGAIVDQLAAVPNRGLDYGLLRYLRRDPDLLAAPVPQVEFNYIGRYDLSTSTGSGPWSLITEPTLNDLIPVAAEPLLPLRYTYDVISVVNGTVDGPQLLTSWRWSERLSTATEVETLATMWTRALVALGEAL